MKGDAVPSTYCWGIQTVIVRLKVSGGVKSLPLKMVLIAEVIVKLYWKPAGAFAFSVKLGDGV
jgi:hypothetical protein